MDQKSLPIICAVHPSWVGELTTLAQSPAKLAELKEEQLKQYMATAYPFRNQAFSEGDVYQINEHEYYSYSDGIRYYLTESGARVALISMVGSMYEGMSYSDYDYLVEKVQSCEQEAYSAALILANSPGGMTQGMQKLNKAIANFTKPIGVYVKGYLASAAAYVTAPADFILSDPENDNTLGSIGVFCVAQNFAKHYEKEGIETKVFRNAGASEKFKPNSIEEWDSNDLAEFQEGVDKDAEIFHLAMENQRGLSPDQMTEIKTGGTYNNTDALRLGLIDGFSTLEEAINKVANYQPLFI